MASLLPQPSWWMECSWGCLAGVHIRMGTLPQWELGDTKRQMCGSRGANGKWSKLSEKFTEHQWPKGALQRTSKISTVAQIQDRDRNQHNPVLSYSCPDLGLYRPLLALLPMWVHEKRILKEPHFFSDLYTPSSFSPSQENDFRGITQRPFPFCFPTPFSVLPWGTGLKPSVFSLTSGASWYGSEITLESRRAH